MAKPYTIQNAQRDIDALIKGLAAEIVDDIVQAADEDITADDYDYRDQAAVGRDTKQRRAAESLVGLISLIVKNELDQRDARALERPCPGCGMVHLPGANTLCRF
jgi:hypothetical protein